MVYNKKTDNEKEPQQARKKSSEESVGSNGKKRRSRSARRETRVTFATANEGGASSVGAEGGRNSVEEEKVIGPGKQGNTSKEGGGEET